MALDPVLLRQRAFRGQDFAARKTRSQFPRKRRYGHFVNSFRLILVGHGCGFTVGLMLIIFAHDGKPVRATLPAPQLSAARQSHATKAYMVVFG